MSIYKLTYFNVTGLGEPIRFLLSYAGIEFEDNRVEDDDWPGLKPQTPLHQLPLLEIDGKTLYQSNSIARFLGKKFDLNGGNDFENFEVDAILETIGDLRQFLAEWFWNEDEVYRTASKAETFEKFTFYLEKLEAGIKINGYFVGGKLSVADIVFAGLSYLFNYIAGRDIIADYPKLKILVEKVLTQPRIKAYIAKRPEVEF